MQVQASYLSFFTVFMVDRLLTIVSDMSDSIATRMKRILFVFSVMYAIDAKKGHDHETICDVNCRLHLSHSENICVASAAAGEYIWSGNKEDRFNDLPVLSLMTTAIERELLTTYFLRRCPRWLLYGSSDQSDMKRDLQRLFKVIVTRDC